MKKMLLHKTQILIKPVVITAILILTWEGIVLGFDMPAYILPSPFDVFSTLLHESSHLWEHTLITAGEIILGLLIGVALGVLLALSIVAFSPLQRWLLPILLISQAIPVFAIAPLLVLWLGYGMASKIAMTTLIIFFPVTTCCYDGLRQTQTGWLEMAQVMGAKPLYLLRYIRWPAALPALASGLRVAVTIAPIGAVIGEWVGSSGGLGYLMLQANAQLKTDEMFASLVILAVMTIGLYYLVDAFLRWLIPWQSKSF